MKLSLLLVLVSFLSFNTYSQEDSVYIEFVPWDSNGVIYASNGYYKLSPSESYKRIIPGIIPNMMRIEPAKLAFNDTLITAANKREMSLMDSYDYPMDYYTEIPKKEYDEIIAPALELYQGKISIEQIRIKSELKFEDISAVDKKRRDARFDFAEIEKQRKRDSIINVQRRKLLLDLVRTPVPVIEGLDTLPIPDPKYFKKVDYFSVFPDLRDSLEIAHNQYRSAKLQSKVDDLLRPYYIAKREVSNSDYKAFVQYLSDSIYLHHAYWNVNNDSLAMVLLDCSKKEKDSLDPKEMKQNYKEFGLKNPYKTTNEFIRNEIWAQVMDTLHYNSDDYRPFTLRTELLVYQDRDRRRIKVYPLAEPFLNSGDCENELTVSEYYSNPYFDDKPVLYLNYRQVEAYCVWKQRQISEKFKKQGYQITVELPSLADYEFALKSLVPLSVNKHVVDQDNSSYILNRADCSTIPYQVLDKEKGFLSFLSKEDVSVAEFKHEQWLRDNSTGGLEFINGGASEYTSTKVTRGFLKSYGFSRTRVSPSAYVIALGSNYRKDLLTTDGTAYTKIFYKSLQLKDQSSAYNGFRLVYKIVPIDKD